MKKLLPALALVAGAFTVAAPANAAVHIVFLQGQSVASIGGFTVFNSFDDAGGISGSNFTIQNVSNGNGAMIPLADSLGTNYLSVLGGGDASFALLGGLTDFAFEWGSLDTYNTLTVNLAGGGSIDLVPSLADLSASPGDGNQFVASTNGTVHIYGDAGEVFSGLTLKSATNSLEIDNLAIKGPLPEASTWAMMIAGLGAVGASMRRRKTATVRFA